MSATAQLAPGRVTTWLLATRPRTLTAGVIPVLVGTAVAWREGALHGPSALAALMAALLIQVGTNLVNDCYDFQRGADTAERLGPPRVTQLGLVSPRAVLLAAGGCFAAAFVIGLYLVDRGGWPILVVGIASLLSGYAYTGGPWPLAYHGLGDVFVFVFFGPVAVMGAHWVQAVRLSPLAAWVSVPVGLLAAALLVVNNLRDVSTDARAGKRTLAVRLGERATRVQYAVLVTAAFAWPLLLGVVVGSWSSSLALGALLLCAGPLRLVWRQRGAPLNAALAGTARLHAAYGVLLAFGILTG
ncbi:MAG: 1,4-dihydroxy-2-naphthoate polyprenyltransferase [Deltaproteobacteria bacterium]|nr:1,4-dihydroxy-2-naphthoate polyprenyltransferase [Deltaproteobacteria bacterium]